MMNRTKIAAILGLLPVAIVGAILYWPRLAWAGLESCTYIDGLIATNPLSSDLASTSDDHLRLIKSCLKASFPNVNGAVSATDEQLSNLSNGTPEFEAAAPRIILDETDATTDERIYDFASVSGVLLGRTRTDADGAGNSWLSVDRSGTTVSSIALASTALTWNGATLFTTANDGSGSGLDADLLDGTSSAGFAQLSAVNVFTALDGVTIQGTDLIQLFNETDAGADGKKWRIQVGNGVLFLNLLDDAVTTTTSAIEVARSGMTVSSIDLKATQVKTNGVNITGSTGTFTATATGCTTSPTGTATWAKIGNLVTLNLPMLACTSNLATYTYTGMSAAIQPSTLTQYVSVPNAGWGCNGVAVTTPGVVITAGSGTITFTTAGSASGWCTSGGSGTKGPAGAAATTMTISYTLQ